MKKLLKDLAKDESGQGMVEYILILAAVIGIVMLARTHLTKSVRGQLDNLDSKLGQFDAEQ